MGQTDTLSEANKPKDCCFPGAHERLLVISNCLKVLLLCVGGIVQHLLHTEYHRRHDNAVRGLADQCWESLESCEPNSPGRAWSAGLREALAILRVSIWLGQAGS